MLRHLVSSMPEPVAFLSVGSCDLRNFSLLGFSVSCEVGADVSAVSSASFLPMCVCSFPGLLPGCYALALVDT